MTQPRPPSEAALRAHRRACERQEGGYIDPESGLFVLTSVHLREQGECCGNGCRHCPWDEAARRDAGRDPHAPSWPYEP